MTYNVFSGTLNPLAVADRRPKPKLHVRRHGKTRRDARRIYLAVYLLRLIIHFGACAAVEFASFANPSATRRCIIHDAYSSVLGRMQNTVYELAGLLTSLSRSFSVIAASVCRIICRKRRRVGIPRCGNWVKHPDPKLHP